MTIGRYGFGGDESTSGPVANAPVLAYLPTPPIFNKPGRYQGTSTTGVNVCANVKLKHTAGFDGSQIRVIYGNFGMQDVVGPNDITVRAAIQYPSSGSTYYPIFFNGKRDVVIEPGAIVVSDPSGIYVTAGDTIYSRTLVSVSVNTLSWPIGCSHYLSEGEGNEVAAIYTDKTTSGTIATSNGNATAYGPLGILGKGQNMTPAVALYGDSILRGYGATLDNSFAQKALAGQYGCMQFAKDGDYSGAYTAQGWRYRMILGEGCSYAVCEYGINEFQPFSVAQVQTNLTNFWQALRNRGLEVIQTTLTPWTTSTDGWTTTVNQTPTVNESKRTQLNDWIRTRPTGLAGYWEIADTVETARNSGIWKVDGGAWTTDGIHPNSLGDTAMIAGCDLGIIT